MQLEGGEAIDFAGGYHGVFLPRPDSRDLVVLFSHARRHALMHRRYAQNLLFLRESTALYFLRAAGPACRELLAFIEARHFARTLFMGSSKGGFGALLWTALCARQRTGRTFRALAFSPQTRIWPPNPALRFPSYAELIEAARGHPGTSRMLEACGDLAFVGRLRNLQATIVHGAGNSVDAAEAAHLAGPNIRHLPLPFSFHGSVIPFATDRSSRAEVEAQVDRIYTRIGREPDLDATLPADRAVLVEEILAAGWIPTLEALLAEELAR